MRRSCLAPQAGLQSIKPIGPIQGPAQAHILLIDQNEVSRLILKHQLEKLGCVVAEASRFQDALLVLRDKTFDLILIDAVLIEASSQSVITEIRALQSAGHGLSNSVDCCRPQRVSQCDGLARG